ncbi:hypothetical protein QE152_g17013 [Popillia japonica]|uniref:Uncharacterized protein n=1 Tax=Popillia japonica TaxID=7064 RepID=A0AAW1L6R1_POPJA
MKGMARNRKEWGEMWKKVEKNGEKCGRRYRRPQLQHSTPKDSLLSHIQWISAIFNATMDPLENPLTEFSSVPVGQHMIAAKTQKED